MAEILESTSFYVIEKGLSDRDSVTLQNRETTAQGLDFISERGARGANTDSWPRESGNGSKILGGKLHPHPGILYLATKTQRICPVQRVIPGDRSSFRIKDFGLTGGHPG